MKKISQTQMDRMAKLIVDDIYTKVEHDSYAYIAVALSPYMTTDPINVLRKRVMKTLAERLKEDEEFLRDTHDTGNDE